jgi:hypothetical protein
MLNLLSTDYTGRYINLYTELQFSMRVALDRMWVEKNLVPHGENNPTIKKPQKANFVSICVFSIPAFLY